MKKSWLEIYGLAVCFFTVACFVVVLGIATWDVVKIQVPEFTIASSDWQRHQSDELFKESLIDKHRYRDDKKDKYIPPAGKALTEARERSFAQEISSERRDGFQDLVRNLIILFIDLGVFFLHWKIAARARKNESPAN
jgi:hypothetical protein